MPRHLRRFHRLRSPQKHLRFHLTNVRGILDPSLTHPLQFLFLSLNTVLFLPSCDLLSEFTLNLPAWALSTQVKPSMAPEMLTVCREICTQHLIRSPVEELFCAGSSLSSSSIVPSLSWPPSAISRTSSSGLRSSLLFQNPRL